MIPFVGSNDLSDLLGEDVTTSDLAIIALDSACEAVRTFLDNPINLETDEVIRLDGTGTYHLVLPSPPVWEVSFVTELGTLTADDTDLVVDDDYVLERSGILRRVDQVWLRAYGNIEVTYTHGWDISETPVWERVPSDIRSVALNLAKRKYAAGGTSAASSGPIVSETIGSYTYQVDGGAVAAATSISLTADDMATLIPYRTPHVRAIRVSVPAQS